MTTVDPTDCERLLHMFSVAGSTGVFSGDIRDNGISGNPSQRIADLEKKGYTFRGQREPYPSSNRRHGKRWWITGRPTPISDPCSGATGQAPAPPKSTAFAPEMLVGQATTSRHAIDDDWDWKDAA